MTSNGIPREIVRKIINHVEPGVTKIYDRYSYDKEKRNTMNKWDRILKQIISGESGKIVEINR
jgi:hypothetical protein